MEESRGSRNKPTYSRINNLWQRSQEYKMRKGSHFNKWCLENWTDTCKEMNIVPHTKSNWNGLQFKHKTWIHKNSGRKQAISSLGSVLTWDFLDLTSKAKINKWDYMKLNTSVQQRKSSTKCTGDPLNEWKISANHICDKGQISKNT